MDGEFTSTFTEEERAARRAQRAAARRKKQRQRRRRQAILLFPFFTLLILLIVLLTAWASRQEPAPPESSASVPAAIQAVSDLPEKEQPPYSAAETEKTVQLGEELPSAHAIVIDLGSGTIVAEKDTDAVISPASMTKILTLLVAAEHLTNLNDTFAITIDITDYCYVNDCSVVGFEVGERVSVRELLYGTILPSGADAALGLAAYVAGSQEAFVALMNEKLKELGLDATAHFTNCVGLYDPEHVCTVYDMAMILKAAMDNPLCREILGARTYETAPTAEHPQGQILSNWFLRRIEDKDTGNIEIIGAKTGYVVQSGSCAASCGRDAGGSEYICVTANAYSSWRAIYDHVELYKTCCH